NDFFGHLGDDVRVGFKQIVAAHTRFARQTGGDDNDVGIFGRLVTISADKLYVKTVDRSSLCQVERFALRHTFEHVHQNDVRQLFSGDPVSSRSAHVSRAHNRNLISSSHLKSFQLDKFM